MAISQAMRWCFYPEPIEGTFLPNEPSTGIHNKDHSTTQIATNAGTDNVPTATSVCPEALLGDTAERLDQGHVEIVIDDSSDATDATDHDDQPSSNPDSEAGK